MVDHDEKRCLNCEKLIESYMNYCSWDCQVALATKEGGTSFCPNGLPISVIRHDGNMYEHEHGDHPDYKFPVHVSFIGVIDEDDRHDMTLMAGRPPVDDEEVRKFRGESHALIYTDGSIALTIYECCYAIWGVREGKLLGGNLWKKGEWSLSEDSRVRVLAYALRD